MEDTIKIEPKNTKIIAHRGASALKTENTVAAFKEAAQRYYYGIETDLYKTADGKYVLIHNSTTGSLADRDLKVEESTFDELRSLKMRDINTGEFSSDLRLPTPEEYIEICKRFNKKCILELKSEFTLSEIGDLLSVLEKTGYIENIIFISFCYDNLIKIKSYRPEQKCQFLTEKLDKDILFMCSGDKIDIDCSDREFTPEYMHFIHELEIEVNVWTIDSRDRAAELIELGIDYITSNVLEGE